MVEDDVTVYDEICHIHHLAADHVTVYDEICDFHHLIVRAVSKYRGFSQQLIGRNAPKQHELCHIFCISGHSSMTIDVFLHFPHFSWFCGQSLDNPWTILGQSLDNPWIILGQSLQIISGILLRGLIRALLTCTVSTALVIQVWVDRVQAS